MITKNTPFFLFYIHPHILGINVNIYAHTQLLTFIEWLICVRNYYKYFKHSSLFNSLKNPLAVMKNETYKKSNFLKVTKVLSI
jgi:hypothetical protein